MLSVQLPPLLDDLEAHIAEVRRLQDLDTPEPPYRSALDEMAAVRDDAEKIAVAMAVAAIRRGSLSRRAAADRLGMHHNTLARWIQRFEEVYENATMQTDNENAVDKPA